MPSKSPYVENPKSGPYAAFPGGDVDRARNRDPANLTEEERAIRERFIEGLLMGIGAWYKAAMYAGISRVATAKKTASMWMQEPYVRERLAELREAMDEAKLITKKELLLNVKSIAFDQDEAGKTRIAGSNLIADLMGWKVNKVQVTGANGGPIQHEQVQLDPSKLSQEALQELLNAADAAKSE